MTLRYSDLNQHDALYNIARDYPGGIEGLYPRIGISSKSVAYAKLAPGTTTHQTSFEEASRVIEACVQARMPDALAPVHAFCWRHGMVAFELPQVTELSDEALSSSVLKVMKEMGEVAGEVVKSLKDKIIHPHELDLIEKEFQEALAALVEMRARLQRKAEFDRGER